MQKMTAKAVRGAGLDTPTFFIAKRGIKVKTELVAASQQPDPMRYLRTSVCSLAKNTNVFQS